MSDFSKIRMPNNDLRYFKDASARAVNNLLIDAGSKNLCPYTGGFTSSGNEYLIPVNSLYDASTHTVEPINIPAGDYILSFYMDRVTGSGSITVVFIKESDSSPVALPGISLENATTASVTFTASETYTGIQVYSNARVRMQRLMIRHAEFTEDTYVSYGKTNAELTALTNGIDYLYNSTSKNLCSVSGGTVTPDSRLFTSLPINLPAGTYIISFNSSVSSTGSSSGFRWALTDTTGGGSKSLIGSAAVNSGLARETFSSKTDITSISLYFGSGTTASSIDISNLMIRDASISDDTFVPYTPTLYDLNTIKADKATTLSGYGITDAKIVSGVITLGSNTITPLIASNVTSTYSSSGTAPVNGQAIADALDDLSLTSKGGSGKYISQISQSNGVVSATASNLETSAPASGGAAPITSGAVYSAINQTTLTTPALTSGSSGHVTIASGGYAKIGNLCVINVRLTIDSSLGNTILFEGLPIPINSFSGSTSYGVISVTNNQGYTMYINTPSSAYTGSTMSFKSGTNVPVGTLLVVSAAYFCQ